MVLIVIAALFFLLRGSSAPPTQTGGNFGTGDNRTVTVTPPITGNEPVAGQTGLPATPAKIFKINDGPVAGATFVQMGRPTTTVARFVMADSGHVFDLAVDSPGSLARAVSNTTIPGIISSAWSERGQGAVLQYLDQNTFKTLHLGFPPATTTLTTMGPVRIQFLPNGITSFAVSPDGTRVAYLVETAAGSDIYTAGPNGAQSTRLASLPLSQILLSWPAAGTLLAQSNSASGVEGIVFSIDTKQGAVTALMYAQGLTATADPNFSHVVYQTSTTGNRATYARIVLTGSNIPLSFDPLPEKCVWSSITLNTMYCAAPLSYVAPNFLDLWHAGVASAADSIFTFNVLGGITHIIASPGSLDGGRPSDIASLALSPDDHYLLYVRKGDRSLWGVRLSQ